MNKVRTGIALFILSWLPVAQVIITILHNNNELTSSTSTNILRLSIWGVQIIIGLVGIWLVGKQAMAMSHTGGWKHVPANLWHLFWSGD